MKKIITSLLCVLIVSVSIGQTAYKDSLTKFIANYVNTHGIIKGDDVKYLQFFPIDEKYLITAKFKPATDSKWFGMETSGGTKAMNRVYGTLSFTVNDTAVTLNIYQAQSLLNVAGYKDYLFLPFTDLTSGNETYANGRYIDLTMKDIINNKVTIDFNKAYNPYCAYTKGFNCPIPPKENDLPVAMLAGEKVFLKKH